jgi:hypothetical protein
VRKVSKYNKKDAASDTGSTSKEVSKAWHDARDHAAKEGGWGVPSDRHGDSSRSSSSDSSSGSDDSGK